VSVAILFNGDGGVRSGQPSDVAKGAPFIKEGSAGRARNFKGRAGGLQGFREVSDGGVSATDGVLASGITLSPLLMRISLPESSRRRSGRSLRLRSVDMVV